MNDNSDDALPRRRKEDTELPWYVDRRIPIALIFAFLLQGSAIIWFAATQSAKIDDHERRLLVEESTIAGPTGVSERLTRVEEKQSAAQKSLDRIETLLAGPVPSSSPPRPHR